LVFTNVSKLKLMFRQDIFGTFFSFISQIEKANKRKAFGITNQNGYDGVSHLNIPHIYSYIEANQQYFCHAEDKSIDCYDLQGNKLFTSANIEYLKYDMFLVQEINPNKPVDKWSYALYHNSEKLTDYIFRVKMFNNFNEQGFAILNLNDGNFTDVVVNKNGEIVYKNPNRYDSIYLKGVLLKSKNKYINLLTNQVICNWKYSCQEMSNEECLFVKTEDTCIYQINISNGEYIIHGKQVEEKPKPEPTPEELKQLEEEKLERERKREEKEKEAAEWLKLTRNDSCKCGSGKKFKNCCINTWKTTLKKAYDKIK